MSETDAAAVLQRIQVDDRYRRNLEFGKPRRGHPEGTILAHILQLEQNLERLSDRLSPDEQERLRLLIHVHDTFKADARSGVPIVHPESHASLARAFLAEYCSDSALLDMVQYHDEPYALWRRLQYQGDFSTVRLEQLLATIADWDVYSAFLIIDGCTPGKDQAWLRWFLELAAERLDPPPRFGADDLLEPVPLEE